VPAPPPQRESHAKPEPEHRPSGKINSSQHVNNDHWYGHDQPNDKRLHLDRPFEHGRFEHSGPNDRYNVVRIDRDHRRFWLPGGYYFAVAPWPAPIGAGTAAMTSWSTRFLTTPDGICCITSIRGTRSASILGSIRDHSEPWYLTSPEAQGEESEVSSTP
jgi:hypothetical protein